ncbi:nuclear receptor coactivator 7 isoform X5 [Anopheles arabiensis]|uniref:nuclear receptor coactivator 7 isoform X5 n=1 Tax=Anopheles arabiensis TaxID=7173 RepID=UPI001AAC7E20|nr:nuclear receptor coactivator 7 isoform X5 [Anopheles arabiensis]
MTSILTAPGKYRSRKDYSTGSIPTLVSLDEESSLSTTTTTSVCSDTVLLQSLRTAGSSSINTAASSTANGNSSRSSSSSSSSSSNMNIKNGLATKPPRRSSLGLALLGGGGSRNSSSNATEKSNKRRSSIAVVFLGGGRKDSKASSSSSPSAGNGHHHHHHNGHSISTIPEKYSKTGESDIENDSPNTDTFVMLGEGTNGGALEQQDSFGSATSGPSGYDKKRRRSSSWQTKLERRRRKGMMASIDGGDTLQQDSASFSSFGSAHGLDSSPYGPGGKYGREKRHSWWNIFVPDNLKQRTRRASQDVILSKSSDTLSSPPYRRSKSRSVDHGLAAPFDLDSLRSKVEGRFESIDRLSKDGEKKRSMPTIPTITYTVKDRDTLTSVAARFDTTPSELTQLNRLASSFIYSGQQLLVPDKNAKASADGESDASTERSSNSPTDGRRKGSQEDLSQDEKDLLEGLRPGSPKPGHIERVASPNTQSGGAGGGGGGGGTAGTAAGGADDDDPVTIQRFLKINVRHITDGQGVVGGVLLVTPNAVMFDPNVSDPLVIEHGPESYGVIAPMEFIVNAAIFNDIAHMRVQGATGGNETAEKAEIYHPVPVEKPCSRCDTHSPGKDSLLVKDETFPELGVGSVEGCDDQESICSSNERDGDAFPKAFERDLVTPNNLQRLHGDSTESGGSSVEPKASSTEPPLFLSYDRDSSQSHTPNSLDHSAGASNEQQQQQQKQAGDKTDQTKTNSILEDPTMRSLEERRRSLLDQHWAIPSKDRLKCYCDQSSSRRSLDDEEAASTGSGATATSSSTAGAGSIGGGATGGAHGAHHAPIAPIAEAAGDGQLVKQSCHDSGIDIRDPAHGSSLTTGATGGSGSSAASSVASIPIVAPIAAKKVYSDADIVLSADWVPPLTIAPTHLHDSSPRSSSSLVSSAHQSTLSTLTSDAGGRKKTSSVSFSVDEHDAHGATGPAGSGSLDKGGETKKNKMLKRLSYPLAWVEGLTGEGGSSSHKSDSIESAPNTGDSNQSVFSKVFSSSPITLVSELGGNLFLSKTPSEDSGGSPVPPLTPHEAQTGGSVTAGRSSIGTFIRQHPSEGSANKQKPAPPKLDYRSMVSIDDMPTLFVSFDMKAPLFPQLEKLELIPRPARACPDPPMYLRLRMGRKIGKNTPLPTTVMSYGKNKLRPEYWFSIPKNKVDELYRFLNAWVQHLYGELDEAAIKERGFELIQMDTEWTAKTGSPSKDGRSASEGEISEYTRESWEVLSMSTDDYRKATLFASGSFDQDFQIPDLVGQTEILSEEHREKLCAHLPARAEGYSWSLVFSTSQHGFSLNSLYRKMHKLESPILIVIEDTDHNVFGALTSCSLHVSDHFYGTGESLLYKFNPHFKVFHWSGENLYFIKGNPESLAIGAGDGKFGLWLDGDLNQGRSQHCSTYSNEPLAPQEDFVIKTLECWAFV